MNKRIHRSREQWAELFNAYEQSGLSLTDFCQANNLSQQYFALKRRKFLTAADAEREQNKSNFAKVVLSGAGNKSSGGLVLNYRGTQLQLPVAVEPAWLAQLIKALAA
ncbi:MAG: hypothetical protein WAO12_05970 [Venatoribacter sp.]